jgi:hypothetical protein
MFDIVRAVTRVNGIEVTYRKDGDFRLRDFSRDDLVAMGINPLDLLADPGAFVIDPEKHLICERFL